MSIALKYLPEYNYEDYTQWQGDWELIEGLPYAMSPSPSKMHQRISRNLIRIFDEALDLCPDCEILHELDWKISDKTVVRPDLLIICDQIEEEKITHKPELIVEILSNSTSVKDRNLKYELFQKEKVKYYLLVDPESQLIEIFQIIQGAYKKQVEFHAGQYKFELKDCSLDISFEKIWKRK